jgi:uncharacterized membrane protein YphA (DoxX/SURF4 family)
MRAIDRFALSASPICLRLILGITFIWSGAGKLFTTADLTPDQQAVLAQIETQTPATLAPEEPDPAADPAGSEIDRLPEPQPEPEAAPETEPSPADAESEGQRLRSLTDPPDRSAALPRGYTITLAQNDSPRHEDDPEVMDNLERAAEAARENVEQAIDPDQPRRLVTVALTIEGAVNPEKGSPRLPAFFLTYAMPFAWAVAIIEFLGGLCLLIGFLARFWAVLLTGVAAGIVWITSLGPAMLGGIDNAFLGFLPPLWPFDPAAATQFLWTMALFFVALAMILLGAGTLSIDRLLFGNPLRRFTYVKREPSYDVNPD